MHGSRIPAVAWVDVDTPPDTVPLFVYGSLRPGMALWHLVRDEVVASTPGWVRGRLHWHRSMEYPLLTIGDGDERDARPVRGELLSLRPGDAVNRVIVDEELLYGYEARWLPVTVTVAGADGGMDASAEALVLVWNRPTDLGPEIESGDYAAAGGR